MSEHKHTLTVDDGRYSYGITANNISTPFTCAVLPGLNMAFSNGYTLVLP